jgi:hypothetical protein
MSCRISVAKDFISGSQLSARRQNKFKPDKSIWSFLEPLCTNICEYWPKRAS